MSYLFWRHKFHKIVNYFISKKVQENLIQFTQNLSILINPHKIVTKLSEIWVCNLGSEIRKKLFPDLRVKKPDLDPDPQQWK